MDGHHQLAAIRGRRPRQVIPEEHWKVVLDHELGNGRVRQDHQLLNDDVAHGVHVVFDLLEVAFLRRHPPCVEIVEGEGAM